MIKAIFTPIGELLLGTRNGQLVMCDFPERSGGIEITLKRAMPEDNHEDGDVISRAENQLAGYFAGKVRDFDLPLDFTGTETERKLWKLLSEIPYGATATYKEIAEKMGMANAARAIASMIGRNPLAIIVPCHRVVGSDGKLHGYSGGTEIKARLLTTEGSLIC